MVFEHKSVLLQETVDLVFTVPDGKYVDCTLGGAGHSEELLQRLNPKGKLICFDQDEAAVANAREKFAGDSRVNIFRKNFADLEETLQANNLLPFKESCSIWESHRPSLTSRKRLQLYAGCASGYADG